ncbi:MAG: DUF3108 domain-containing protein [Steroidobacteraceae bacterium]|nr:DUF3108 domain-containing protein [Steroidobacteraceae bacterium]
MRTWVLAVLAGFALSPCARAADGALEPFVAEYDVRYGSMSVGSSRTELRRGPAAGQWSIESLSDASGLARLVASGTLSQRSVFETSGTGIRPLQYRFDDGTRRTGRDVALDFDWRAGRVTGTAEAETVDLPAGPGLQDAASIQALVLLRLRAGVEPGTIDMIEKDYVKHYRYTLLRRERIKTALGTLDTVVYRSAREGSSRETLFWHAPSLGYAMVQAEQRRDGKKAFQTYIRSYQPGR